MANDVIKKSVFNKTYCDTLVREDSATKKFNHEPTALSNEPLGAEELGADFFTTVR